MKLYYAPTSPYVRKVMVLLHETGQLDDVSLENASGTPFAPAANLGTANPLSKVPALERPEGCTLYDSRVICRYLDDRAKARLYPEGARLWETLTLEATADGMMDAALLMTYEARLRPEDKRMPDFVDAQWAKIERACAAINARWMSHLAGPLDAAQIAVGCALAYLDLRHDARGWRNGHTALAEWYAAFAERPSMQATVPPAG
ncbi:glutathione S-transferase [Aestuariicoccus sp. MJ-SS9]|uniref:glutathione S-transferase n=1 Tax=Aestuariicoccus sp. MJ-SS9 TaxID=3079855 RepID=UPI00290A27AC|nr:glutathione S-transferase [Aestuariicoccus sp. MJ-SS9]MDU8911380.1 glutathione S-transferase [Aestuariicoccus sp. MJ-SS9]